MEETYLVVAGVGWRLALFLANSFSEKIFGPKIILTLWNFLK